MALALLVACGRLSFDAHDDGGAGSGDGPAIDAPCINCGCAVEVAAGAQHTCVRTTTGAIYCAGWNLYGQLGTGIASTTSEPTPVEATTMQGVTGIVAGSAFVCGLTSSGAVRCVGENIDSQVDDATTNDPKPLGEMPAVPASQQLATGNTFGCAITVSDQLYCWGDNDEGQAGTGVDTDFHGPEAVPGITGVVAVTAGSNHICAVHGANRSISCWGDARDTRLGSAGADTCPNSSSGSGPCAKTPVAVAGYTSLLGVSGGDLHTCAWDANSMICWGGNSDGQLGLFPSASEPPGTIGGIQNVRAIAAASTHTCALLESGAVMCWGDNQVYELGNTGPDVYAPTSVALPSAVMITASSLGRHTCAVGADRRVSCWGANEQGQLGRGMTSTRELPGEFPVPCP